MNALTDETKSERIDFAMDFLREVRISPTVRTLLNEEKPSHMSWADFAVFSMVAYAFIARIIRFDIVGVIRLGVRLAGPVPDERREPVAPRIQPVPTPTFVGSSDKGRKPLVKAAL